MGVADAIPIILTYQNQQVAGSSSGMGADGGTTPTVATRKQTRGLQQAFREHDLTEQAAADKKSTQEGAERVQAILLGSTPDVVDHIERFLKLTLPIRQCMDFEFVAKIYDVNNTLEREERVYTIVDNSGRSVPVLGASVSIPQMTNRTLWRPCLMTGKLLLTKTTLSLPWT
jgi:hypothetical protein